MILEEERLREWHWAQVSQINKLDCVSALAELAACQVTWLDQDGVSTRHSVSHRQMLKPGRMCGASSLRALLTETAAGWLGKAPHQWVPHHLLLWVSACRPLDSEAAGNLELHTQCDQENSQGKPSVSGLKDCAVGVMEILPSCLWLLVSLCGNWGSVTADCPHRNHEGQEQWNVLKLLKEHGVPHQWKIAFRSKCEIKTFSAEGKWGEAPISRPFAYLITPLLVNGHKWNQQWPHLGTC